MKQHVVENRPERVVGVGTRRRLFNRLRDSDSKRARRLRLEIQDPSSRARPPTRACEHPGAPRLHHRSPKRLLLIAHPHHVHANLDAKHLPRHRERTTPLTRAGLSNESANSGKMVVVGLRDSSVRLMRTGRAHTLILVVDARRSPERFLQTSRAVKRSRTPTAIDLAHRLGNRNPSLSRNFLLDDRVRKDCCERVGTDWFSIRP